jgi:O-antigen/teichoic acid export membrane protein
MMVSTPARTVGRDDDDSEGISSERINRNLADLLQELRVAALGVQMLFGFLVALPFYARFSELGASQRDLYRVSVLAAAAATALLISPVAYHRWVFRRHQKAKLVKLANVEALLGLAMVGVSLCCVIGLVFTVVGAGWFFALLVGVVMASFMFLWFALPIFDRITTDRQDPPR